MATNIQFTVITPEREVVTGQTDAVTIPAIDGELGVLPRRAPLMCELGVGQFRYRQDGRTKRVLIEGGFAQVYADIVTVLTGNAIAAEDITDAMIDEARQAMDAAESGERRTKLGRRLSALRTLKNAS
jgi:F-type H+-transporting ATPase subunit epsilon